MLSPHLAERRTQPLHPQQSDVERGGQADHTDRRARVNGSVHQADDLFTELAGYRRLDPAVDLGQPIGPAGQHEADHREANHQHRKHREDGEVGDAGGVEVTLALVIALLRAHRVVQPGVPAAQPLERSHHRAGRKPNRS